MNPNFNTMNTNFSNLSMQENPYSVKPFEQTCDICVWETLPDSQRTFSHNWSDDMLAMHRSKHLPFMQQGVHYYSTGPYVTATNIGSTSVFASTTNLVAPTLVKERVLSEVDVFPERVEVFERHVYPNPQVNVMEKLESFTEVEKEIVHVHPVKLEKEIVHVHPSLIEKEVTHIQPVTIHVQETVVHPEKIVHETEEKMLATSVVHEQERDILPTKIEYEQEQVFAEEFIAPRETIVETVAAPTMVQLPVVPPVQETVCTTTTTTTETLPLHKDLGTHTTQTAGTTTKATGKKHGLLHRILHPHEK